MLHIFHSTLDIEKPTYEQNASLIGTGTNPGVGFRPHPDQDTNVDSTLIWFNKNNPKDFGFWSNQLKEYIDSATVANYPQLIHSAVRLQIWGTLRPHQVKQDLWLGTLAIWR